MEKIVDFAAWCGKCDHKEKDEHEAPCDRCIANPVREDSRRPIHFTGEKKEETSYAHRRAKV